MKRFIFITGGARSGKSSFAVRLGEGFSGKKLYLATAAPLDDEMKEKIERHRRERGNTWETVEEPSGIAGVIKNAGEGVALIDCLTLWTSNLMEQGLDDGRIESMAKELSLACRNAASSVIAVSNEVGSGIVPEKKLARRFRDLSGVINQLFAACADEVYLVSAGIPLKLK